MKPRFIILVLLLFCAGGIFGQRNNFQEKRQKIENLKIAFLTEKLNLHPKEAQEFWPVYNEFSKKKTEIQKEYRQKYLRWNLKPENLTDAQLTELAGSRLIQAQRLLDLRKEYQVKFKEILPPIKVIRLYEAEKQFQKLLLKKVKEQQRNEKWDD
jgi:hypothetical protein